MLSPFPYDMLWTYSEKFTRDVDLRQDLVLLAWQQDERFGNRSEIRLLKNFMKYRAKEISSRNSLGKSVGGKSKRDAYSQPRVSINKRLMEGSAFTLADTRTSFARDPLATCIANQFEHAMSPDEQAVCNGLLAGYPVSHVKANLKTDEMEYQKLKSAVKEKAMEYLA